MTHDENGSSQGLEPASGVKLGGAFVQSWAWTFPASLFVENSKYGYRGGTIATPDGNVGVYDQPEGDRQVSYTRLDFTYRRRTYSASWERNFSDRYLKTLARRFAASVVSGTNKDTPS